MSRTFNIWSEPELPILGYRKNGAPIYQVFGGAAADFEDWVPVEYDSEVIKRVLMDSAVERYGQRFIMNSFTRSVPRSSGITVNSGGTYTDSEDEHDRVLLTARKLQSKVVVDEDELNDANSVVDVLNQKALDWAVSYADFFDNASLAVTGAENGTTRPYTSVYQTLRSTFTSNPDLGYTADDNRVTWDGTYEINSSGADGTSLYEKLNDTFKKLEGGKYWSQADTIVVAHPNFRSSLRLALDGNGAPIFKESAKVDPVTGSSVDMLFNTPIAWSRGAKLNATATDAPTGNDLLFVVNARYLLRGDRSGPETRTDMSRAQDSTDDAAVKFRARRGFALGHPKAAAVMEAV